VSHFNYDNLLAATYKLEDISTMERVHRWVAGGRMLADKPLIGFGPANFYNTYQDYTLNEFQTYVSNNPEKSGIHNYYLMMAVEQGIFGLLIFLALLIAALIRGEALYHRMKDEKSKIIVLAALICIVVSCSILLINDMLEADKIGPIFFFSLSVLVIYDVLDRKESVT
jgi:O-antigen ligase